MKLLVDNLYIISCNHDKQMMIEKQKTPDQGDFLEIILFGVSSEIQLSDESFFAGAHHSNKLHMRAKS